MCLDYGEVVQTAFLDLSEVYDSAWIDGLIYKLSLRLAFSHQCYSSSHRSLAIVSNWSPLVTAVPAGASRNRVTGIPQGTVLDPILFSDLY